MDKSKNNKPQQTKKQELEDFSNELIKRLGANSNNSKNGRTFNFRFNPLIFIVTALILVFIIFSLLNRDFYTNRVTLDEAVSGIKDNKYSQVIIQNDSKVTLNGKNFMILNNVSDFETSINRTLKEVTLNDFMTQLGNQDVLSQLKSLFNRGGSTIKEVIIGNNFIILKGSLPGNDEIIRSISEEEFANNLKANDIHLEYFGINIIKLRSAAQSIEQPILDASLKTYQVAAVWSLDTMILAELKPEYVERSYIDWDPRVYSFTDLLQQEGISLTQDNVEIIPTNIPTGISIDQILTVLTLVGFVVLGFIIFRGAQSSGMGISQFGQSKAKVFFGSKTDTTFKDVAGIDEAREELNEIVDFLRNPNKYRKLGARIPKGILMVGAPGTGKTLLARAIAGEAGVPFFHTSGSEFEEMLVGAGASRVRDLFAKAKKAAPSLIFIDEIDAVARKRGTRIQSGTTEQTLNQILVEMDGFEKNTNVIVIAATNRPDVLDPAILRPGRFDRQVRIELPDVEGRKQILEIHGKNKPFASDVNLEKIAKRTVGFSGADLENILNEAAIIAAKDGNKEINMNDIDEAVSKVVLGPAKKSRKRTENELKLVAYHEAGHAVVSKYTPNSTPVDRISIVSRGSSGGVTMFLPENDEYIMSKRKLLADITVSLGGRAAEEVALDDISTGASNDIEKATAVARRMVQKFGMSKKLGLVQYGDFEENEYLGYAYGNSKEFSDKTAEEIDSEVKDIVAKAYENAVKILQENRDKLDRVAKELLEKEVLGKEEFEKLF